MGFRPRPPKPGELQKFVDGLVARDPGVQSEVRRMERLKEEHKKRGERAKLGQGKIRKARKRPKPHVTRNVKARRRKAIDEYGACKTCKRRAISHGDSPPSQRAAAEDQCLVCYYQEHRREKSSEWGRAGGEYRALTLIERHGICPKCGEHPIASGSSEPSILAREDGVCIYCYRASRPKRTFREKVICKRCGQREVSQGKSQECLFARRTEQCLRCYKEHAEEIR